PPFIGGTAIEVMQKQLEKAPLPPRQARPDLGIPAVIEQAILKALDKDRTRRFRSAASMKAALLAALDEIARAEPRTPLPGGRPPPAHARDFAERRAGPARAVSVADLTAAGMGQAGRAGGAPYGRAGARADRPGRRRKNRAARLHHANRFVAGTHLFSGRARS